MLDGIGTQGSQEIPGRLPLTGGKGKHRWFAKVEIVGTRVPRERLLYPLEAQLWPN